MTKRILTPADFTTKYFTAHINSLKLAWLACNNIPRRLARASPIILNLRTSVNYTPRGNLPSAFDPSNFLPQSPTSTTLQRQEHYLTCMSYRIREIYEETHAKTGRTCKVHKEKPVDPSGVFNSEPSSCHETVTTRKQMSQSNNLWSLMFSFLKRNSLTSREKTPVRFLATVRWDG